MLMHGFETTVPVTLDMMILQGHAVMRGSKRALVVVDMPFAVLSPGFQPDLQSSARARTLTRGKMPHDLLLQTHDQPVAILGVVAAMPLVGQAFLTKLFDRALVNAHLQQNCRVSAASGAFHDPILDPTPPVTLAAFDAMFEELKNWGRWGADDELGTLNYITPDKVAAAAALVRKGRCVSMAIPINKKAGPDNPNPAVHFMSLMHDLPVSESGLSFGMCYLGMASHGDAHTYVDALNHVAYKSKLYNGKPASLLTSRGSEWAASPPIPPASLAAACFWMRRVTARSVGSNPARR